MTFHDLLWPSMTFYHLLKPLWPSMIKCLLSSPGLISGPLKPKPKLILTEFQGLTLSTPYWFLRIKVQKRTMHHITSSWKLWTNYSIYAQTLLRMLFFTTDCKTRETAVEAGCYIAPLTGRPAPSLKERYKGQSKADNYMQKNDTFIMLPKESNF